MAARHRGMKKAAGGQIKGVEVPGADVMKEAEAKSDGFKKGGKAGMKVEGKKAKMRADRIPRRARGGSPFSEAASSVKKAPDKGDECA